MWNTYGPTEATVVACAARLGGPGPVRIGLPLDGWDLAVVGADGPPVADGEIGELIIGGVGLARYLDPAKDAEKFAAMPTLGWDRAYRSGDLVRLEPDGLVFVGRADDQVKLGGRRIELGEVDAALRALPGVAGAAAAVRRTPAGNQVLVGYLAATAPGGLDLVAAQRQLRDVLPAALVPLLAVVDDLPTRTSGKVDRDALPWPLPGRRRPADQSGGPVLRHGRVAGRSTGPTCSGPRRPRCEDDFFDHGGGSLSAAQLVSPLRSRFPEVTVADVYDSPRLGDLAATLDEFSPPISPVARTVQLTPRRARVVQELAQVPVVTLTGLRWLLWLAVAVNLLGVWAGRAVGADRLLVVGAGRLAAARQPAGRIALAAAAARLLLRGRAGRHLPARGQRAPAAVVRRGSRRAAGGREPVGRAVDRRSTRERSARASGRASTCTRCRRSPACSPSARVPRSRPRSTWPATGSTATSCTWGGSGSAPARPSGRGARCCPVRGSVRTPRSRPDRWWRVGAAGGALGRVAGGAARGGPAPLARSPAGRGHPLWVAVFGLTAALLGVLPLLAATAGLAVVGLAVHDEPSLRDAVPAALLAVPLATVVAMLVLVTLTAVGVRLLGLGLRPGYHPVRSRTGWQVWATERLLDEARTFLFPLYASLATPAWLRLLGATVGKGVEASTVLPLPRMTTIGDEAFLADDTMIGSYELGGGWLRIKPAKIGKRAFLGNSGMTAPGRAVPKRGLVAVLSATPKGAKTGSSWLGNPPVQLRRDAADGDQSRTYAPPLRLKVARGAVELARLLPVMVTFALGVLVLFTLQALVTGVGWVGAGLLSGLVLMLSGAAAAAVSTLAKWALVGRLRPVEQPLWSSFVWRNELADTFVETVAVPWFVSAVSGTAALNAWLRSLGASVGRGVWCETYWLPEADLVRLGDGVAVNRGCVLQTHLFHDRIMSMDTVTLDAGATLGPQQRDPAGRVDRRRRHGRPRVARAARRDDPARARPGPATPPHPGRCAGEPGPHRARRPLPARARQPRLVGGALRPRARLQGRREPARCPRPAACRRRRGAVPDQPRPRAPAGQQGERRRAPGHAVQAPRRQAARDLRLTAAAGRERAGDGAVLRVAAALAAASGARSAGRSSPTA